MSATATQPRILIVDDTKANVAILVRALRQDYRLGVARSGEEALEDLRDNDADLVLLDIMMPGLDGYEVCRRIKEQPHRQRLPVIFITALTEIDSKARGFELGAVDYITKPFEVVEVRARVRTHLQLEAYRRDLEASNRQLARLNGELDLRVHELEATERLVRAQMSAASVDAAAGEILAAVAGLTPGTPVALLRPAAGGEQLDVVAATEGDTWPPSLAVAAATPPTAAWRTRREQTAAGELGLPLVCGERAYGVLWARGEGAANDGDALGQSLRRVADEAALLLQATSLIESIQAGGLDVDALLDGTPGRAPGGAHRAV